MMKYTSLNEIREKFLSFFESKDCLRLDSFSLVPKNDASLLLINSGMAPMKAWFKNPETAPKRRVTTCQKCIRTGDIENVGKTARHGTYFEMLGNFSFGDYFKKEATSWAWEFFTKVMEIPEDRLWISVYEEDDETKDLWINHVGVNPEHIVKLGKEDNFWEHGTGPCGPCSEIYFDRGEKYGCGSKNCGVGCECDRFMEVWNLVFTQFDKDEDGNYNRLPNPNIDTGMGLERLAVVMQGVDNLFEVDTVQDVIKHICKIANLEYKKDEKKDISLRVISDHIRSTVMMVSDGVIPSNEGRGYVLRRLLRRAARHGKLLNIERQFLNEIADTVIDCSKCAYPELEEKRDYIKKIIKIEEERFDVTIDNGIMVLTEYIEEAKKSGKALLSGEQAFKLHDTYGFPLDLTIEMAQEQGLNVDVEEFNKAMQEQKQSARDARSDASSWDGDTVYDFELVKGATAFTGYDKLTDESVILGIVKGNEVSTSITADEKGVIITENTPFYAEMGGQAGDIGTIYTPNAEAKVVYTKKTADGIYLHEVEITKGTFSLNDKVSLAVDVRNRNDIARNHSATHLLHKALKNVLGSHVAQAGSLVTSDRLRFDFSHFEAMTESELKAVEEIVNTAILDAMPISVQELPIDEAKKLGAAAQFGEKYGDVVRVVSMGDFSIEFCGGTHVTNTAICGLFKIISENGVAAGVRRIEAITGRGVLDYISQKDSLILKTAEVLKSNIHEIDIKANSVVAELKDAGRKIDELTSKLAGGMADDVFASAKDIVGVKVISSVVPSLAANDLAVMGDKLKDKLQGAGVIVLASEKDDKISFIAMANKDAVGMGVHSGNIIREITKIAGGSGGGKPDLARGGGKDASKLADAISAVDALVEGMLK